MYIVGVEAAYNIHTKNIFRDQVELASFRYRLGAFIYFEFGIDVIGVPLDGAERQVKLG